MQKVITVTTHTNIMGDAQFVENEYPVLNSYLEDGYVIINSIPALKPNDSSYMYSITFILDKP